MSTAIPGVFPPPRGELDRGAAVSTLCPSPGLCPELHDSVPHSQRDPQAVTDNWAVGGKKKSKLNSKQSLACISSGPAALGKCSSVPSIIYLPSLQIPRSSSYNEQMQMWNCHSRANLCLKQICPALCLQVLQGSENRSSEDAW